ncbi:MAG TPA: tetratricopeptide repeat protein [Desulfobacteraceae bacterium]|nr:tetratricopeptide repeat protein [Deltaproteobacteria bacterium]HDI59102.1 tetratricopeptide repeat protein [Desulfobacteraceae bacterium]
MKRSPAQTMVMALVAMALVLMACTTGQVDPVARAAALRDLGEAHLVDGAPRAALRELLEAERLNSSDPRVHNLLGLAYDELDRLDLADQHFSRALELKPDFSEARNNLAVVLLKQGQYAAAIDHLERILEDLLYPTPQLAACNLGWAYYRTGRQQKAEQAYRLALSHYKQGVAQDQTFIRALVGLGRVLLAQNRAEEAVAPLQTAAGLVPGRAEIQFELGRAYAAVGDTNNARYALGKVIELAPDSDWAKKARDLASSL